MSLNNEYTTFIAAKLKHTELLDRAAERRLAALVPRRPPLWRRLASALTRRTAVSRHRQPTGHPVDARRADLASAVPPGAPSVAPCGGTGQGLAG